MNGHKQRSTDEEIIRAGQAAELLDHPFFKEASAHIEAGIAAQRRKVPMRETEMHTRLILTEQLWHNVLDYLQNAVDTGKLATFAVQEQEKRKRGMFGGMR